MLTVEEITRVAQEFGDDNRLIKSLLHPLDEGKDFITSGNAYRWYAAIAILHPSKAITEIGCRFGYSIGTMVAASSPERAYVIDNECYIKGSVAHWQAWMKENFPNVVTKHYAERPDTLNPADLVSVDGDHSYQGTLDDLIWAWWHCKPDGYLIIDDIIHPFAADVKKAADYFIKMMRAVYIYLPSFRGTYLIAREK